jgi:hypothetical protein
MEEIDIIIRENGYWSMPNYAKKFKEACTSIEWRAALIVYEKYKRKHDMVLQDIIKWVINCSEDRITNNKKVNLDILIQETSKYVKNKYE